jgi:hypothetical protein
MQTIKEKNEYNIQDPWDIIKKPNLSIHKVGEKAKMQIKGIGNIFNIIIGENIPNLCNGIDS